MTDLCHSLTENANEYMTSPKSWVPMGSNGVMERIEDSAIIGPCLLKAKSIRNMIPRSLAVSEHAKTRKCDPPSFYLWTCCSLISPDFPEDPIWSLFKVLGQYALGVPICGLGCLWLLPPITSSGLVSFMDLLILIIDLGLRLNELTDSWIHDLLHAMYCWRNQLIIELLDPWISQSTPK